MSTTQHTPGPWKLVYNENGELELGGSTEQTTGIYSTAGFGLVANVVYRKTNILGDSKKLQYETFLANAQLIAAAPETAAERDRIKQERDECFTLLKKSVEKLDAYKAERDRLKEENEKLKQHVPKYLVEISNLQALNKELVEALEEAKIQLEYLDGKFGKTGTTASTISMINTKLQKAKDL